MKKPTLKQELEAAQTGWTHLVQFIFELMQCSIGDTIYHYMLSKDDFKYDRSNIEEMIRFLDNDMISYKEQIGTCCRKAFPKEEYAKQMMDIMWEEGIDNYLKSLKRSLLRQAKKEEAKKAKEALAKPIKKGKKNETRVRPRTKR